MTLQELQDERDSTEKGVNCRSLWGAQEKEPAGGREWYMVTVWSTAPSERRPGAASIDTASANDDAVPALEALAEELASQRAALASAHRRQAAQVAITRILARAEALVEAGPEILRALCEGLGWEMGAIWTVDAPRDPRHGTTLWYAPEIDGAAFAAMAGGTTFAPGVGLPGRVWA